MYIIISEKYIQHKVYIITQNFTQSQVIHNLSTYNMLTQGNTRQTYQKW